MSIWTNHIIYEQIYKYLNPEDLFNLWNDTAFKISITDFLKSSKIVNWNLISNLDLSLNFISEFKDKLNWDILSYGIIKESEDVILEFKEYINWKILCSSKILSENTLRFCYEYVDWCTVAIFQELSTDFIFDFEKYMDWHLLSLFQKLSEELIIEFKDKVNWTFVSMAQKLSQEFIRKYKHFLDFQTINCFQNLSEEFRKEFIELDDEMLIPYERLIEHLDIVCYRVKLLYLDTENYNFSR